jgi:hypothetical protein
MVSVVRRWLLVCWVKCDGCKIALMVVVVLSILGFSVLLAGPFGALERGVVAVTLAGLV